MCIVTMETSSTSSDVLLALSTAGVVGVPGGYISTVVIAVVYTCGVLTGCKGRRGEI